MTADPQIAETQRQSPGLIRLSLVMAGEGAAFGLGPVTSGALVTRTISATSAGMRRCD
jgi:hypothetical protein